MEFVKIIGTTAAIVIPMIIGCAFISGKSKKFIDKLSGKTDESNK